MGENFKDPNGKRPDQPKKPGEERGKLTGQKRDHPESAVFKRYDKQAQFAEWYPAILKDAELVDARYPVKGFFVHRPWATKSMMQMYRMYETELERTGHEPAWFPALVPRSNLQIESEHLEGFVPQVFWVNQIGNLPLSEPLAMRPTSETIMYPMFAQWVQGLKDLPLKIYQSCQVWRAEPESKALIRGREFHWIEAHDVFATQQEAEAQVREDMRITEKVIHRQFGIPMLYVKRPSWDTFPGAEYTMAADTILPDGKVLQLPSTHFLGQKFSKPFDITFTGQTGRQEYGWQTCYGPAIWRIFGALIAVHADGRGLRLPFEIAPVQVVVVPIGMNREEDRAAVSQKTEELKARLENSGWRVRVDGSENNPGFKYNHWEMKGVPIRLEVGAREVKSGVVTLALRTESGKSAVPEAGLETAIAESAARLNAALRQEADEFFNSRFFTCNTVRQLRETSRVERGMLQIPFCSMGSDGGACADRVKAEFEISIRGTMADVDEPVPPGALCVGGCGREATVMAYAGKRY